MAYRKAARQVIQMPVVDPEQSRVRTGARRNALPAPGQKERARNRRRPPMGSSRRLMARAMRTQAGPKAIDKQDQRSSKSLHTSSRRVLQPRRACSTLTTSSPPPHTLRCPHPFSLLPPVKSSHHGVSSASCRVDLHARYSSRFPSADGSNFTVG